MFDTTRHATSRMQQRGLRQADLDLVLATATPVADDALMVTEADADREIAMRKREIKRLQRLRGCKVIVTGETIVTVYRARRAERRRTLRRAEENR